MLEGGKRTKGYLKESNPCCPLVSVVTVVFNGESFLQETINSVVQQSYENIEYIIVDGESSDGTLDIIRRNEDKIDYWLSEKDDGLYDAMNKAIQLCHGIAVKLINADDLLKPDAIEKCIKVFMDQQDSNFVINGYLERIDMQGNVTATWTNKGKIIRGYDEFLHPSWFVPMKVYKNYGLYSTEYKVSSDYEYYLRLKRQDIPFVTIQSPLVSFRLGGVSYGLQGVKEDLRINKIYAGVVVSYYDFCKKVFFKKMQKIKNTIIDLKILDSQR